MKNILEILNKSSEKVLNRITGIEEPWTILGEGADGEPTRKVDSLAEKAAFDELKKIDASIISEESGSLCEGENLVLIDPIDGTGNFVRGIPFYSYSVAYLGEEGRIGLIRDLVQGDVYTYSDGVSRKNGEEISVSNKADLRSSSICLYCYGTDTGNKLSKSVRRTRTLGSIALELCFTAKGIFDGLASLRGGLSPPDYLAGLFILEGAGGVSEIYGENSIKSTERTVSLLAGPSSLVKEMGRVEPLR